MEKEDLIAVLNSKICEGNNTVKELTCLKIEGISKLQNKFKQELNFLNKLNNSGQLKKEHFMCSNLNHLQAVAAKVSKHKNDCVSVMTNKILMADGTTKRIRIDLILNGGSIWIKVIARNPKALSLVSTGEGSYGQRSVVDQADDFIKCSQQHLHFFKPPTIVFFFANGIDEILKLQLENMGIKVESGIDILEQTNMNSEIQENVNAENISTLIPKHQPQLVNVVSPMVKCPVQDCDIQKCLRVITELENLKLNLGVTTLIAYVSALTNGGCHYTFETEVLNQHAEWERARPVKPILEALFKGRKLYACESAIKDFKTILKTLGGKSEIERANEFLNRVEVVEDKPTEKLKNGNRIKYRSRAIFGTGEHLQAITVTANHAFVRSARNQGVEFAVFLHESRALTEGKQPGYCE